MRFKKVCATLLSAVLVFSLVGCANTESSVIEDSVLSETPAEENNTQTDNTTKNAKTTYAGEYNNLFDTSYVHEINVIISEDDWTDLKTNPLDKTKYNVNVEIDGETVNEVSFATKGNTSLSSVASDEDTDRYSFKINFGKFNKDQTYYGLDKLNLNNIYADATYMKDYISYYIFNQAGVESPLTSYVELKINGESFGLYLAIEEVDESYLSRIDSEGSQLYKPETEMLGNMDKVGGGPGKDFDPGTLNNGDFQMPEGFDPSNMPSGDFKPGNMPGGDSQNGGGFDPNNMPGGFDFGNMFGGSSSGAALKYTDDNIESYSDIFDNAVTDATDEDKQEVITALKKLSEGNAEEALDVTEVINYFVAHNFVLNYDSYTGSMLHNYYLKETDGKLSVIPWDYNLSFGAFSGAGMSNDGATSLINTGIDSPLSGASEDDRPLWSFITSNEEYLNQYHEAYNELMNFINSGELQNEMNRVYEMIYPYVEKDNSAFYTVSEFEKAFATLTSFCSLRAESITKQLAGELATVTSEQKSEDKVDASIITINDMGSQNQNKQGGPGNMPGGFKPGDNTNGFDPSNMPGGFNSGDNK